MGVNNKKKVVFLFGAGAEGEGQYGMPSGNVFKKKIICKNKKLKEFVEMINKSAPSKDIESFIREEPLLVHNKNSVLKQTILEYLYSDDERKKETIQKSFGAENYNIIMKCVRREKNRDRDDSKGSFKDIYKKDIYDKLDSYDGKSENHEYDILEWFLENACIYSDIDSLFNCLRYPNLYPKSTARLVKMYYSAFLAMFDDNTFDVIKKKGIKNPRKTIREIIDNYYFDVINKNDQDTYYKTIGKYSDIFDYRVLTTNYTKIAQYELNLNDSKISYMHGKMGIFEELKSKKVGQIDRLNKEEFIIPFIMVQSGVKPIVSPFQMHEFSKAIRFLENADVVVVLGYGINSDDEHIQTMLKGCVKKKTELYYFIHNEEKLSSIEEKTKEILENCKCKKTSEFEVFLKELANKQ